MADITDADREVLASEYEAGGKEGPYPTYADLARRGQGEFTLCALRAIAKIRSERDALKDGMESWRGKCVDARAKYRDYETLRSERDAAIKERDEARAESDGWQASASAWGKSALTFEKERDSARSSLEEAREAIRGYLKAREAHDASNDGFGRSRDTYAKVIEAREILRRAAGQGGEHG